MQRIRILEKELLDIPGLVGPDSEIYKYKSFRVFITKFVEENKEFMNEMRFKTTDLEANTTDNIKDGLSRLE